jgi:hypothetical protein
MTEIAIVAGVGIKCGTRGILALLPSNVNVIVLTVIRESGRPDSVDVRVSERS